MTEEQQILLSLLANNLFGKPLPPSLGDQQKNWHSVFEESKSQAVVRIAFLAVKDLPLSSSVLKAWENTATSVLANNIRVLHSHALTHEWMSKNDIPYVILKGGSSAYYYPCPIDRNMGDVDFLVPTDCLEKAGKALKEQGLCPWEEEHLSHIVYRKGRMHLEMHFNVAGIPEGEKGALVRSFLSDAFEKAELHSIDGKKMILPSPVHHGLIILLHIVHHLTGEGVGLRHLCDWAIFENSFSDEEFRTVFEEKLQALGLWRFAQILTRVSIKYLGADEKSWADADDEIVDTLMEDILSGGNFGRKDSSRSHQSYLISSRGKNGVGSIGIGKQFIKSVNDAINVHWPRSKQWKILIPFGWIYFGYRRLFQIHQGKWSKINASRIIKGASARREIYKELKLFE